MLVCEDSAGLTRSHLGSSGFSPGGVVYVGMGMVGEGQSST